MVLCALWRNHREALDADWLRTYSTMYRPVSFERWLDAPKGAKPRANVGFGRAWALTREILKDHTSHSYAALAGFAYIPTGEETAMWDRYELEGRLKRKGWRPWTDRRADPFRSARMESTGEHEQRMERRSRLRQRFHITD